MADQTCTDGLPEERDCKPPRYCKPVLRGYLSRQIRFHLLVGIGAGLAGGLLYYFLVGRPRKQAYANFYKNYDGEEIYKDMQKKKLFSSR